MRDPRRIQRTLNLLEHYWNAHPQLRLGQIVINHANCSGIDPYAFEDDDLAESLEASLGREVREG